MERYSSLIYRGSLDLVDFRLFAGLASQYTPPPPDGRFVTRPSTV